ncbi:WAT1-related protein At4g08300-like [Malus sylvestris]|uniref:WAT1-related protein At4g08300-like n=1 Tax=Malus sylvestris TaxID=3752 RepID=UPI0021AC3255|nr:WAT1-related protein At4g08300-like [Malus sylvestris]XP_050144783.1 WAT1-related protein At4g08300-like [Malus sylvestris]XP_050144784.1 WAT1-related protein At4g08300-like [Malus sylvestris]
MTMTLYKVPAVRSSGDPIHIRSNSVPTNWTKRSILLIASFISWFAWHIEQAITLKKYPAQLSLTAWIYCIGAAQSAVFTLIIQHKQAAWSIRYNNDFWSIIYAGVVCSGYNNLHSTMVHKTKRTRFCDHCTLAEYIIIIGL